MLILQIFLLFLKNLEEPSVCERETKQQTTGKGKRMDRKFTSERMGCLNWFGSLSAALKYSPRKRVKTQISLFVKGTIWPICHKIHVGINREACCIAQVELSDVDDYTGSWDVLLKSSILYTSIDFYQNCVWNPNLYYHGSIERRWGIFNDSTISPDTTFFLSSYSLCVSREILLP